MNLTYLRMELLRVFREPVGLFFTAGLPAFLYIIFGAAQSSTDEKIGSGNVAMYVMISMAAYGAVTATVGVGGSAAIERLQGWGRQLGLTPISDVHIIAVKATVAVLVTLIPITIIYALGYFTGAEGDASDWILSALIVVVGSWVWALYGLAVAQAFRSEEAVSVASGLLVILAFLGNVFFPLSGTILDIGRFTPLYGYVSLARYPLTDGYLANTTANTPAGLEQDPLWLPLLNMGVWTVIFALLAVYFVRKGRGRQ
ncbi:ABC transporter permease [Dermacoccaceae bacterium W4C1]